MEKASEEDINKEDDDEKEIDEAIEKLDSESLKVKCLCLSKLSDVMEKRHKKKYKEENKKIGIKEQEVFLNHLNKIRDLVKTRININTFIDEKDEIKYCVERDDPKEFEPIKNFWKISLVNANFFEINEDDLKVLNYLKDICFVPLNYPSFRIEFYFEPNEYMKESVLTKNYYYEDDEKESPVNSEGCTISWNDAERNPTKRIIKKNKKKGKVKETVIITKNRESFFNIFNTKNTPNEKDSVEANFMRNDFLQNILEYYLNIMEIRYEEEQEGDEVEDLE